MAQVTAVLDEQLSLFPMGVDMRKLREERASLLKWKRSPATHKGYAKDSRLFTEWCTEQGREAMPATAETLELFTAHELKTRGFKVSTVRRRIAAIIFEHKSQGHKVPDTANIREMLAGARRQRHEKQQGKKALDVKDLARISLRLGKTNKAVRDRALLVFGFASALRRSELVRLTVADIKVSTKGILVDLSWSKADQEGNGRTFGVFAGTTRACTDPVRTMRAWLNVRGSAPGPLFTRISKKDRVGSERISECLVNRIVKRAMSKVNLDPKDYGAHSLRAGLVTAAAENGASEDQIMRASGHKSPKVMRQYIRPVQAFAQCNPLAGVL